MHDSGIHRTERVLRGIHEIALDTNIDPSDEVRRLMEVAREELGVETGVISRTDGSDLEVLFAVGEEHVRAGDLVAICDTFCADTLARGKTLAIHDTTVSRWRDHPGTQKLGLRTYCGVPIRIDRAVRGTFCGLSWSEGHRPFSQTDLEIVRLLAQRIEAVIDNQALDTQLKESEERFRATFEHANVGIAHVSPCGKWLRVNPRLCEILGYSEEQLLGLTFQEITHPDDLSRNVDKLQLALSGEIDSYAIEKRYLRSDGSIIWAHLTVRLLRSRDGEPSFFISVIEDVTERKAQEAERRAFEARAHEAQRLESLGMLAGGIAHDFNNLLTSILGNASIAGGSPDLPLSLSRNIDQISNAATRAAELTNQLLTYAGRGVVSKTAVDLNGLTVEMMDLLGTVVSKNADLRSSLASNLPMIEGDSTQLRQVLMNLITNASDALEGKTGKLLVKTRRVLVREDATASSDWVLPAPRGEYVALIVEDTGKGMSKADRRRIFEPFFTTRTQGRGLGLASVMGIVRAHSGGIKVISAPSEGTTIEIVLPIALALRFSRPVETIETTSTRGHGLILVADDEPPVREVVQAMLESNGYRVITATNGEEAVERVREHHDLLTSVLLDITMPGKGGIEALHEIRRIAPTLPAVLMSGYNEQRLSDEQIPDLQGWIQKPFTIDVLMKELQAATAPVSDVTPQED